MLIAGIRRAYICGQAGGTPQTQGRAGVSPGGDAAVDPQGASMAASINSSPGPRERDLRGQIVLVIGGSSSIGLETARLARARGADIILTARDPDRLERAGLELGPASPPSTPPTSAGSAGSSTRYPRPSTTCWSPPPAARRRLGPASTRPAAPSTPISCCRYRSPGTPRARSARQAPCSSPPGFSPPDPPLRAPRSPRRSPSRFPP